MSTAPLGALFFAWCTLMAVAPIRRPRRLALLSWISSVAPNEVPLLFLYIVVGSAVPTVLDAGLGSAGSWISLALAVLTSAGLIVVALRSLRSGPAVQRALAEGLGKRWRSEIDPRLGARLRRRLPLARILFVPWMFGRHDVERLANIAYGDDGTSNLLDVYRHRSQPVGCADARLPPRRRVQMGRKSREARPLLYHLASQGWTCISANYHLGRRRPTPSPATSSTSRRSSPGSAPTVTSTAPIPSTIFLVGASAGAHLTAMAALTANDPTFQPGFEDADTSITAGIGLYGYYGPLGGDEHPPTTPLAYARRRSAVLRRPRRPGHLHAPPRAPEPSSSTFGPCPSNPVVYAELPGAQHSFDLFHSVRFETVIDAHRSVRRLGPQPTPARRAPWASCGRRSTADSSVRPGQNVTVGVVARRRGREEGGGAWSVQVSRRRWTVTSSPSVRSLGAPDRFLDRHEVQVALREQRRLEVGAPDPGLDRDRAPAIGDHRRHRLDRRALLVGHGHEVERRRTSPVDDLAAELEVHRAQPRKSTPPRPTGRVRATC